VSLDQLDRVGVFPFAGTLDPGLPPKAGRQRLLEIASHLADLTPRGETDFRTGFAAFAAQRRRKGLCVVVSDFFDPGGLDAVTEALKRVRHRLLLVQVVRKGDADPDVSGDVRLVDCESGLSQDVTVTPAVLARYRAAHRAFTEGLAAFARSRGAGLFRLDADRDVAPQLASLFEGGRYVA
jgi:uncharacterized protein (DUF58 family)